MKSKSKKAKIKKLPVKKNKTKKDALISKKSEKILKGLSKKESDKYKKILLTEKTKMFKEFLHLKEDALNKSPKDASGDLSGYSYHLADMATDVYDTDFTLRLAADERERLYEIEEALKRIDDGVYGRCQMCMQMISKNRLQAKPSSVYCISCQQKEEHKGR